MNDDESLLAAASLCMDHFQSHICLPLDWTDDTSMCHCLDLVLSHMCELANRGLSVCCHLSVLKQHVSGITRVSSYVCHAVWMIVIGSIIMNGSVKMLIHPLFRLHCKCGTL